LTTPTAFNNWLWYVVVKNDSGYFTGYRSVFDSKPHIDFTYFPRNEFLLDSFLEDPDTHNLIQFARDYYTVEKWNDTLVFNDLRFGQIAGWHDPHAEFAFHYFINLPGENTLVVQRGRFMGWDKQTLNSMIKRIKGN
jgi:inner membrane protein